MKITPYFSFAIGASIATISTALGIPRSSIVSSSLISPESFEPMSYVFLFVIALLMIASTPRASTLKSFAASVHKAVFTTFSGLAGAILGWALGASFLHVFNFGLSVLIQAVLVMFFVIIFTLSPIWMYMQVQPVFEHYSKFRIAQRRGMVTIQIFGFFVACVASYGFFSWWLAFG